ncbi:phosphopantetheine-binding protein [Vibrio splendidus]
MTTYLNHVVTAIGLVLEHDDVSELHEGTLIERDLGFDSGLYIELIMYLEDAVDGLNIDPATLDIKDFESIGSIAQYISNQTQEMVV